MDSSNSTRDSNRLRILEAIRLTAPTTRAELARLTGLSAPAITHIVNDLLQDGFLLETGRRPQARGQPPIELDLNPTAAYTIGLHLDRDVITGVVADLKGKPHHTVARNVELPTPAEALALLVESSQTLRRQAQLPDHKLLGVGIVTVGPLDVRGGRVTGPPNFPGWSDVPLRQQLADHTGLPVYLDNNATAAAIGERWYGVGMKYRDFLYVYIGLGIGGGLVLDGRIHRGAGLNAGEFGHMLTSVPGRPPRTLEASASILALRRELGSAYASPELLADNFVRGDPKLLQWLRAAATPLAQALASADNLLDVEAIIIGGRYPKMVLDYLVEHVRRDIEPLRMAGRPHYASIQRGRVGDDTAALGAAILPL
ncbi:MAG TPA: ROK family transcriptional regulator, partial [Trueperaceae bacterium]